MLGISSDIKIIILSFTLIKIKCKLIRTALRCRFKKILNTNIELLNNLIFDKLKVLMCCLELILFLHNRKVYLLILLKLIIIILHFFSIFLQYESKRFELHLTNYILFVACYITKYCINFFRNLLT